MKLVLFDIDGTLITHIGKTHGVLSPGYVRFVEALKRVYQQDIHFDTSINYAGTVDKYILKKIAEHNGIIGYAFEKQWPVIRDMIYTIAKEQEKNGKIYHPIQDSIELARVLAKHTDKYKLGFLTGNVEQMSWWKLEHAGIHDAKILFPFGVFGDETDDRITLAKTVFAKAKQHFGIIFTPKDVVVIGDALGDIQCARAIGATVIITTTGYHDKAMLEQKKPDLLVDSLLDPRVLEYFKSSSFKAGP